MRVTIFRVSTNTTLATGPAVNLQNGTPSALLQKYFDIFGQRPKVKPQFCQILTSLCKF